MTKKYPFLFCILPFALGGCFFATKSDFDNLQMQLIGARAGSNVQLLTPYTPGVRSYRASPDWSPDGRAVAYEQQNGNFQVWMIDLRDRVPKQLTSEGENEDPSWAPDGRHIVFTSSRGGDKQLWILDTESGRARQLTHSRGARLAAWSPVLANPEVGTYSQ